MTENIYDWYCDYMLPKGPCGLTADDVQAVVDKHSDGYTAMRELLAHKRGLELKRDTEAIVASWNI